VETEFKLLLILDMAAENIAAIKKSPDIPKEAHNNVTNWEDRINLLARLAGSPFPGVFCV